ncbi:MAG: cyclic lactone autoinducer peptide [Christensenellaceae bacterium]|nr:cyclic lactone autoinducer peptide [Christensenellaceae bacterium]
MLRGLALVSKRAAVAGAGLASQWGHDQPKTPEGIKDKTYEPKARIDSDYYDDQVITGFFTPDA